MQHMPIFQSALENTSYRKAIFTHSSSQVLLMSLNPSEDTGVATYESDSLYFVVSGAGMAGVAGEEQVLTVGDMVVAPASQEHVIMNSGKDNLKLIAVFAPKQFREDLSEGSRSAAIMDPYNAAS